MLFILLVLLMHCATTATAQSTAPITGADVLEDVIDHTRFDSLWRESKRFGKIDTKGVNSDAYREYRKQMALARPDRYLPASRLAYWINAYLALLMEAMNNRVGYRATVWDSLYLQRDTATVANAPFTLKRLADTIVSIANDVQIRAFLATGSSNGPPFPAHALYARTVAAELRTQLRKLVRSERYVLYDPAGNVLQLAVLFNEWFADDSLRQTNVLEVLLPWMNEAMAAQIALNQGTLAIQISDRIETWKRAR